MGAVVGMIHQGSVTGGTVGCVGAVDGVVAGVVAGTEVAGLEVVGAEVAGVRESGIRLAGVTLMEGEEERTSGPLEEAGSVCRPAQAHSKRKTKENRTIK